MAPSKMLIPRLRQLTRFIPQGAFMKAAKLLICLLFLLNIRSWPLIWHFRVFRRVFSLRLQYRWVSIRSIFRSSLVKLKMHDDWWDTIAPVGQNPFTKVVPYNSWASLDECDFNGHLSNSSYGKTLDCARFKTALDMFPIFFRAHGSDSWMALAATHFHFIREIPMLSTYEIRTSIAAWDRKWLYAVSKCVRKSGGKKKGTATKPAYPPNGEASSAPIMSLREEVISLTGSPFQTSTPGDSGSLPIDIENELKMVTADLIGEEPDGATLHTIIVSQFCFKIGRITVPPALILALNGFTGVPGHSLANPHPEWAEVKRTMSIPFGGSATKLKELMVGGWRDVPESERWWNKCLGEGIEAQRVKNLSMIEGLRKGLERARAL